MFRSNFHEILHDFFSRWKFVRKIELLIQSHGCFKQRSIASKLVAWNWDLNLRVGSLALADTGFCIVGSICMKRYLAVQGNFLFYFVVCFMTTLYNLNKINIFGVDLISWLTALFGAIFPFRSKTKIQKVVGRKVVWEWSQYLYRVWPILFERLRK